jgi:hypothetical protein
MLGGNLASVFAMMAVGQFPAELDSAIEDQLPSGN